MTLPTQSVSNTKITCKWSQFYSTTTFIQMNLTIFQTSREECSRLTLSPSIQGNPCTWVFSSRKPYLTQIIHFSPPSSTNKITRKSFGFMTSRLSHRLIHTTLIQKKFMILWKSTSKGPYIPTLMKEDIPNWILCSLKFLDWLEQFPCFSFSYTKAIISGVLISGDWTSWMRKMLKKEVLFLIIYPSWNVKIRKMKHLLRVWTFSCWWRESRSWRSNSTCTEKHQC